MATTDETLEKLIVKLARLEAAVRNMARQEAPLGDLIVVEHRRAQGTDGGDFLSGADRTVPLTDLVRDDGGHASLASNQITLAAGTYEIVEAWTVGHSVGMWRAWFYNVTDSAIVQMGSSERANATGSHTTHSLIAGETFTITASTAFELRARCDTGSAGNGFGKATNLKSNDEVYARVILRKLA